ncbi:MAG: glycosyltransferase involved in cell wall biosynthesis [Halioglobus sp.]
MNVLLLSAYAAQSHVHWQNQLVKLFPEWKWQVLSLPPRHFSWRVRGNPLYWSVVEREVLEKRYDLVVATSMVDLATLRGLVPNLATIPTVLYFHENQFAYPHGAGDRNFLEPQMVSLYSAMAADHLLFNSRYNRDSFMNGCEVMLDRFPDKVPAGVVDSLAEKSTIIPVPLEHLEDVSASASIWPTVEDGRPIRLIWIGRFEFDKGGDGLLLALHQLEKSGIDYALAVIGQRFRNSPAAFGAIEKAFAHRLVQFGFVENVATYRQILVEGDIVFSTALHEFQGLAVLEAVSAGCVPAVPDRLAYPEIYPGEFRYASHPQNPEREAVAACALIMSLSSGIRTGAVVSPDVSLYCGAAIGPLYRQVFESTMGT